MKKSVLILGAGAQGNVVGTVLSRADDVGRIVLADLDAARAEETARSIGSDQVEVARDDEARALARLGDVGRRRREAEVDEPGRDAARGEDHVGGRRRLVLFRRGRPV